MDSLKEIPTTLEGQRVSSFSKDQIEFLLNNFHVVQVEYKDQRLLHFKSKREMKEERVNILKLVVEKSGVQRKTVKEVYAALVEIVHGQLKEVRKCRLPELATINIRYRDARKAGKVANRFKPGEFFQVKARKASNKIKINPLKKLREFADKKIPVMQVKIKKGKKKK